MIYNLAHNGNKLITFTINGTTYQAINGMTWAEWVDSEYNVNQEYFLSSNTIYTGDGMHYIVEANRTDTIKDNSDYTLRYMSGGGLN